MVTAELAIGTVAVVLLITMLAGAVSILVVQMSCADAASEIARQVARGDEAAVAQAKADLPDRATVTMSHDDGTVTVEVTSAVRLFPATPEITVRAEATTILEPGE